MSLSITGKRWIIKNETTNGALFERVLAARGIENNAREKLFAPDLARDTHDATLLPDFGKAVERIRAAIEKKERIFVVGDYDVDGVTGSAILFKALQTLGAAVSVRLPHRMIDGYGLNEKMVTEARELGVKLIVTVDNGVAANAAIAKANELGVDVIVTDHHLPPATLPNAYAIVNPRLTNSRYPFKYLAGAGVAWKIATHLLNDVRANNYLPLHDELLAFATLGTIADICPLVDENRAIVTAGLQALSQTKNPGLLRIYQNAGITPPVTAEDVGFRIGPRLNAAGRLDSALTAFQTLTHPTHAAQFADELEKLNQSRRNVGEEIIAAVFKHIDVSDAPLIIASSPDWHRGVIGLAAGRVAERLYRPVILMEEHDGLLVGSCRCPLPEFNITDALASVADLLTTFGGHRAAAGFTLPLTRREELIERLQTHVARELVAIERTPSLTLDTLVSEDDLTLDTAAGLTPLAPFGAEHPEPTLLFENVTLAELRPVGETKKHLSCRVGKNKTKAIAFGFGEHLDALANQPVDLAVRLAVNEWQGRREVNVVIVDARKK